MAVIISSQLGAKGHRKISKGGGGLQPSGQARKKESRLPKVSLSS